jgi:hypothetical protein
MGQRLVCGLLVLAAVVCAQRRVDPKFRYNRVIAVVPFVGGKGTPADPKRPQYVPWPPSTKDPNGILGFTYVPSDDGRFAIVEFVARNRAAFQNLFNDKTIQVFEEGLLTKADLEVALKQYRKDFDLNKFGMVMP